MPVTVDVCVCTHRNCIQHHLLHFCSPVYGPPQEEHREMWKTIETNCVYACGGGDDRVLAGCSERTIIRSENTASHSWNMYVHSPDDHSRRALNERESDCCLAWPDERNEHLLRRVFALMVGRLPTAHAVQHVGWCDVRYGKESSPCARGKLHLPSVERHSMRMDADDASVRRCVNISFGDGHSRACCRMLSDAAVAAHTPFIPAWRVRRNVAAEWTLRHIILSHSLTTLWFSLQPLRLRQWYNATEGYHVRWTITFSQCVVSPWYVRVNKILACRVRNTDENCSYTVHNRHQASTNVIYPFNENKTGRSHTSKQFELWKEKKNKSCSNSIHTHTHKRTFSLHHKQTIKIRQMYRNDVENLVVVTRNIST